MGVQVHATAAEFLETAEETLLREEALYNLILGVASRVRDGRSYGDDPPYFLSVLEAGELRAAAVRTPPHPLILAVPKGDVGAIETVVNHLRESDPHLPGVNGLVPHATAFARLWERRRPVRVEVGIQLRIHELRTVIPPSGVPGVLRPPREEERDILAAWIQGFQAEAVPDDPLTNPHEILNRFFAGGTTLRVWDDDGPVSMAGSSRSSVHGATVSLVYTPPENRGRGYASACVAGLSQLLLDQGYAFCALYTDLANPTSNKIYRAIGYRPLGDATVYRFSPR
ncbi:MAG: GNAT family N-acetyltransferase [Candidatus Bipolaricaulota bacterium]